MLIPVCLCPKLKHSKLELLLCICAGAVSGDKVFPVAIGELGSRFIEVRQRVPPFGTAAWGACMLHHTC